jgi:hypothetical protein
MTGKSCPSTHSAREPNVPLKASISLNTLMAPMTLVLLN